MSRSTLRLWSILLLGIGLSFGASSCETETHEQPASQLSLFIDLASGDGTSATVSLSADFSANNDLYLLHSDESLTSNGISFTQQGNLYMVTISRVPADGSGKYHFVFTQGQQTYPFDFAALPFPAWTSPVANATLSLQHDFTVVFPQADASIFNVVKVDGTDAQGVTEEARVITQGPAFAVDHTELAGLHSGAGTLTVKTSQSASNFGNGPVTTFSTDFSKTIPVTWTDGLS